MNATTDKGYIQYNPVTKRKFFISHTNPFIKYQYEEYLTPEESREYRKASAEIQRLSQNYPIQGSSSDISKLAGCFFFKEILQRGWFNKVKIVNFVHDEFVLEVPEELVEEVTKIIIDCMKKAGDVFCKTIPLDADAAIGDYWIH